MSEPLTDQSRANLRNAFTTLEESKVKSPHDDIGPCLSLIRLRDLVQNARLTTSTDSRHLRKCRKCFVRFRAMQSELNLEPRTSFDRSLAEIKRSRARFAIAERLARDLFHRLHAHRGESDRIFTWDDIQHPVLALRGHHHPGDEEDAESIVLMTMAAVRSALADASTPFACSLDAAWPVAALLVNFGAEATRHHERIARRFAFDYAELVAAVPIPIKGMLTYSLRALLDRPQIEPVAIDIALRVAVHDHPVSNEILAMLAATERPELALIVRHGTDAPDVLTLHTWVDEISDHLRVQSDISTIVDALRKNLCTLMKRILECGDSTEQLVRLLLTRDYLNRSVARIHNRLPHTIESLQYLGDLAHIVMRNAQLADHQYFVATEALSVIGANHSVTHVMAKLLDRPDEEMRRALFVYFLDLVHRSSATSGAFHFVGEGADWVFEGDHSHPIATFGNRAATMAKDDPEIASLVDWSRLHLTQHKDGMTSRQATV